MAAALRDAQVLRSVVVRSCAVLLPLVMALTRKGWMSARNFAFDLQRGVYRVTGVVFVGASLYHAVGAMSVPVPPPDLLLYNEASAAYHTFFAALNAAFAAGLLLMEPPSALLARAVRIEARGDAPDWGSLPIIVLLPTLADYMLNHLHWDKRYRKSRRHGEKFNRASN